MAANILTALAKSHYQLKTSDSTWLAHVAVILANATSSRVAVN
jgi:hypothetical protein